jgi:pyruvate dehydrogenase E1 component alpha subunit
MNYRTQEEVDQWRQERDPIDRFRESLLAAGLIDLERYAALVESKVQLVQRAIEYAEASPWPDVASASSNVTELDPLLMGDVS